MEIILKIQIIVQNYLKNLINPSELNIQEGINTIELNDIGGIPHYWINNSQLYNANNGNIKKNLSEKEALYVANNYMKDGLKVSSIELLEETNNHHEIEVNHYLLILFHIQIMMQ